MKMPRFVPAGFVLCVAALLQLAIASPVFAYTWNTEFADQVGDVGYLTGIALDSANVHIIYSDSANNAIRYAKKTSAGWTSVEILKPGSSSALVLDAAGDPHISYISTSGTTSTLGYGTKTGNAPWAFSTVESSSTLVIRESAIAIGTNGSVHISYRSGTQLKYATKNGATWATTVVDGGPPLNKLTGSYSSIAVAPNGLPRISYYNLTDKSLMYAESRGTTWALDTADFGGDIGWFTSLAIDAKGFPHISYYDQTRNQVKYITWDASGYGYWIQNAIGRGEVVETISLGNRTAIILNSQGVPAIAYQGGTIPATELRYAARTGSGTNKWVKETVDTGGAGVGVAMRQITDDQPHISYSLLTPSSQPVSKLKHAYPSPGPLYVVWVIIFIIVTLVFAGMKMRKPAKG